MLVTYLLQDIADGAVLVCLHIRHASGVLDMFVATGELDGRHGGDDGERRQVRSWRCCPEVPSFRRTLSGTRARTVRAVKSV